METMMKDVISALESLIKEMLLKQPTPDGLEGIYKVRTLFLKKGLTSNMSQYTTFRYILYLVS